MSIRSRVVHAASAFVPLLAAASAAEPIHAQSSVDLSPVAVAAPSSASEASTITVSWTVRNFGSEPLSGTWTDEVLLSDDAAVGDDLVLATATVTATVGPGKTYSRTRIFTLPYGEVGSRRIIVRSDVGGAVVETNEANNVLVAPQPIQIEPRYPDLVIVGRPKLADVAAGESITIEYEVRNVGTATTSNQRADELACTFVDDSGDTVRRSISGMMWSSDIMPPGSTVPVSRTLRVPSWVPRDAVWELTVDAMNFIDEGEGEDNNSISAEVSTVPGDLELDVFADAATCPGGEIEVMYVYRNVGKGTIIPSLWFAGSLQVWTAFYLSLDETLDESDRLLLERPGDEWSLIGWGDGLPPGGSVDVQEYPTVPADVPFGKYRLLVAVDRGDELGYAPDSIYEDPKSDVEVWASDPIEVGPTYPDLVVSEVSGPSKVQSGEWCSIAYTLTNQGLSPVHQVRGDVILVAFDVGGVGRDFQVTEPLFFQDWIEPGASVTRDVLVRVPSAAPAEITWRVATDWENDVPEGPKGEDNNENDGNLATVGLGDFEVDVATPAPVVPGAAFEVRYDYRNVGKTVIMPHYGSVWPPPFPVLAQVYLSTDEVLDSGDLRLLDRIDDAELILQSGEQWGLQPGETVFRSAFATLPYGTPGGPYRILVAVDRADLLVRDGFDAIAEPDGLDREIWSSDPFEVTDDSGKNPDLVVTRIVGPSEVESGGSVTIEYSIRNDGGQAATGSWYERIHVSVDGVPGNADDRPLTEFQLFAGDLKPGETVDRSVTFLVPASTPRDVRWQVRTDVFNFIAEGGGEGNNVVNGGAVEVTPPDIEMSVATPASTCPGGGITIGYAYSNVGGGSAYPPSWSVRLLTEAYLSTDEVLDSGDIWLGWNDDTGLLQFSGDQPGLQPGETVPQTIVSRIPTTVPTGIYRVLIAMDRDVPWQEFDAIWEDPRVDRELWASPAFEVTDDYPDLRVTSVDGPSSVLSGEEVTVRYRVENAGAGPVSEGWYEQVFTSVDGTMGNADDRQASADLWRSVTLGPGESRDFEVNLRVPSWTRDGVRWAVRTDLFNAIYEGPSGEANNALLGDEVGVTPADVVVSVAAPGPITAGQVVPIAYTWTNVGKGTVYPGIVDWFLYSVPSRAFLSTDAALDPSDREIWSNQDQWLLFGSGDAAGLQPGESVSSQGSALAPSDLPPGDYRLIVAIDRADDFAGYDGIYEAPGTDGEIFASVGDDASDLAVESVDAPTSAAIGSIVTVSWTVRNQGEVEASGPWIDEILLSTDAQAGDDVSLTTVVRDAPLGAGAPYSASASVTIPAGTASGPYRLLVRTDAGNSLVEFDESNNVRAADAVTSIVAPDLSVQAFSVPSQVRAGQSFPVTWTVRNSGTGDASGWTDAVYVSADSTFGPEDAMLAAFPATGSLAAGSDLARSGAVAIPVEAGLGLRHLFVVTDAADVVVEANESNNRSIATPIDVIPADVPDLVPSEFVLASSWSAGQPVVLEWTVSNAGTAATSGSWIESVQAVNAEGQTLFSLVAIGAGDSLAPGASTRRQASVTVPNLIGTFRFELVVDRDDAIEEGKGDGNNRIVSGDVAILAPDLVAGGVQFPSSIPAGQSIPFAWTVSNVGAGAVYPVFSCRVRFSTDGTLDPGDLGVTVSVPPGTIPAGGSVPVEASVWTGLPQGEYRIFVEVDPFGQVFESDEGNGVFDAGPITIIAPNLVVTSVTAQSSAVALGQFEVSWTVSNTGTSPAVAPWNDRLFVSSDDAFGGDTAIFDRATAEPLAPGESRTVTAMVPAPSLEGQYWVFVQADLFNQVPEGTREGDNVSPAGGPITVTAPNLVVTSVTAESSAVALGQFEVSWTVSNTGTSPAVAPWNDRVFVSIDDAFGGDTAIFDRATAEPLAPGESRTVTAMVPAPSLEGQYWVFVQSDLFNQVPEGTQEGDNVSPAGGPITVTAPNLVVTSVTVPSGVAASGQFEVSWTVSNAGSSPANAPWNDRIVLSGDDAFGGDMPILDRTSTEPLAPGESRTMTATVTAPSLEGQYWVFVQADLFNQVPEGTREGDNVSAAGGPITVVVPDLVVASIDVPTIVNAGAPTPVSWTISNLAPAPAPALGFDRVELVVAPDGSGESVMLRDRPATEPVAAVATVTRALVVTAPDAIGPRFIRVTADAGDAIDEGAGDGNNALVGRAISMIAGDLTAVKVAAPSSVEQYVPFEVEWTVRNVGAGDSYGPCWTERIVLSADATPDAGDRVLADVPGCTSPLRAATAEERTQRITVDDQVAPGQYFLLVVVDAGGNRFESDESNNVVVAGAVEVLPASTPNLTVTGGTVSPTAAIGGSFEVSWTVANVGSDAAAATAVWSDRVTLSANETFGDADDVTIGQISVTGPLAAGVSRTVTRQFPAPAVPGTYRVRIGVDAADEVFEYQGEGDNLSPVLGPFTVAYPPRPDLVVTSISAPPSAVATQAVTISYVVRNHGETAATGYWREAVELVSDDAPNAPITIGNFYRLGPLEPGGEITRTNSITLPLAVAGLVRVAVRVDSEANVAEGDPAREANNRLVDDAIVAISEPPLPDLVAVAVTAPTKAVAGDTVTVAWQGRNEGELPTAATWVDRVFLSGDAVLSNDDTMLGSRFQAGVVKPGEGWNGSLAVTLPDVTGPRWFLVHVDSGGAIEEGTGEANNVRASDVACAIAPRPLPNLAVTVTGTPPSWRAGDTVQLAWRVSSSGDAPARGPWSDGLYLSIDDQVGPDDLPLRVQQYGGDLAVGASYDRVALVNLPVDYQGGTRRLLAKTDVNGLIRQVSTADDLWVSSPFTLEPTPAADLIPSAVAVPTGTLVFGGPITVAFTETNSGSAAATGLWSGMALISKDNRPSSDDVPLGLVGSGGTPLAVGQSVARTVNAALPLSNDLPAGSYWITVRSDVNAAIPETVETNNVAVVGPFTIERPPLPNLVMSLGSVPTIAAAGEAFPVTVTTTNSGAQPVTGNTFFRIEAIAEDGALTTLGTLIVTGPIEAGASKVREESFTLPQLSSPSVRLRACADSTDLVVEASEIDNCFESTPIAFRRPDLTVVSVNGPATAVAGTTVQVSMTVRNDGNGAAGGFWTEEIRLSSDAEIGSDRSLVSRAITTPLAAGASVTRNVSLTIPDELEGQLRWVAAVDASQSVYEGDEADNELLGAAIAVQPPDRPNLVVENVTVPPTVLVGKPLSISFTVRNAGTSATAASWSDAAFISDNPVLTPSDASLGTKVRVQNLQPGESYTQIITGIAPVVPGTYRIFAATDANRTVIEESPDGEADNTTLAAGTVVVDDVAVAVEALLAEVEYPAAMPVRIHARTIDGGDPVAGVPVRLVRSVRGYPSTIDAITGPDGFVDVAVQPTAGLAGLYRFGAAVRGRECELAAETVAWGIDVLAASGEIRVPQGGGASGRVTVRNLGDIPVPGTTLAAVTDGSGLSVQVTLPDGDVLGPDESREATYLVSAGAQAQSGTITFTVDSDRTEPRSRQVTALAVPQIATLVADPSPVVRDMLVGATSYFSVTIRNLGTAPSGPLAVEVSAAPWLSLVSPTTVPGLPPGGSANIDFRLDPAADLPLGPYSATPFLFVRDTTNTSITAAVNGTFTATSDASASVRILARNEFSYNAARVGMAPSYPNATVEIRRFGEQAIVAGGPVDELGEALFERLEAGLYDITVSAPQHGIFRGTRRLDPGSNDVTAFLPRQLVNYEWTVVPIPFTDEYRVTINLVFETNVPAPVITVDPVVIDFRQMQQPTEYREMRVTNHGLITALDVRFEYEASERYEVIPLYESIGDLGPGQTRIVPVLLIDREFGQDGGVAGALSCEPPDLLVVWDTLCDLVRESRIPVGFIVHDGCGGSAGPGVPWFPTGNPACYGCGGGDAGPGGVGGFGGIVINMPNFCDECTQKCAESVCQLFGRCEDGDDDLSDLLDDLVDALGGPWKALYGAFQCGTAIGDAINIYIDRWYWNEEIPASRALETVGNLATKCAEVNPAIEKAVDIATNIAKVFEECECVGEEGGGGGALVADPDAVWLERLPEELSIEQLAGIRVRCSQPRSRCSEVITPGEGGCLPEWPAPWQVEQCVADQQNLFASTIAPRNRAVNRLRDYMKPSAYMLGGWERIEGVRPEEIQRFKALLGQIASATDEASLGAGRIVEAEYNAMLSMPRPDFWTPAVLAAFVERWHRSLDYFQLGWYRHSDVPEGHSHDFIAFATMSELVIRAGEAYTRSVEEGYQDAGGPAGALLSGVVDSLEGGQGVCVEVAIELEQTVTLTRQAFAATLALDNATSAPIEAIDVDLFIKDLDGNDASAKFAVLPPAVTGMGDANGNGQLDPGASGSVRWTLVPGDSAAPQGPTFYRVSGRLRYGSGGAVVDIPLFPVTITVLPNPSLSLEYFIETQVYSDDPFTPEIEPTVPFSLGLWAKNNGGGTAGDVRVESAQPRIVANESGALIDFQLIGTQVNEDEVSPSLAVSMGDILPGEVAVAQWLMTSSIQGEFTSYSATVRSTNGFNDPEFAVVDEANVSALTHVVRADDPFDDGRPDFLGNLIGNALDLPDRIFLSSGASEPVDAQIDATVTVEGLEARIASEPVNGWKYIRIDDPFEGSRPLSAVIRSDGKELRLGDNAWQTAYITRDTTVPQARRYVHLFDRGGDGVYVAMFAADEIAPSVVSWSAVAAHGAAGPVGLAVPADAPASDSRSGGISKFIVSFSEPIDPETIGPVNVQVTAYNASGVEVDVPVADRTLDLRLGNQFADIGFPTPLPNRLRYCIKLVGVRDLAGNLLEQASASIDLVSLAGDVTGDLRVTVNDAGAIGSLVGTSVIDPTDPYQVRSDVNRDGAITMADATLVVAAIGTDFRFAINPCTLSAAAPPQGMLAGADGRKGGPAAFAGPRLARRLGSGWLSSANPRDGASKATPEAREDAAADGMPKDGVPPIEFRLIAARPSSAGAEAFAMAIAAFDLPAVIAGEGEGAWSLHAVPAVVQGEKAFETLRLLLEQAGVETALVVEREDGSFGALRPIANVAWRDAIPQSWRQSVVETTVGSWTASYGLTWDGRRCVLTLETLSSHEFLQVVAALATRPEVERIEPQVDPIGVAPDGITSGSEAALSAEGEIQP